MRKPSCNNQKPLRDKKEISANINIHMPGYQTTIANQDIKSFHRFISTQDIKQRNIRPIILSRLL